MRVRTIEDEEEGPGAGPLDEAEVVDAPSAGNLAAAAPEPPAPIAAAPSLAAPASGRLSEVNLVAGGEGAEFRVRVTGDFSFSTFRLPSPERFVTDRAGVVAVSARSTLEAGGGPVERIRVAQFQSRPEPIARLVFDLRYAATPQIERDGEGLRIAFPPVRETTPPP